MRVLLDTHVLLWWLTSNPRVSQAAIDIIANRSSEVIISAISGWEIALKYRLGKLPPPADPTSFIPAEIVGYGFRTLHVTLDHALAAGALPFHHKDPFDRLLIAQAQIEDIPIITADTAIAQYNVRVIW